MRIRTALAGSSLVAVIIAGAGIIFAYSQGQFPGHSVDGPPVALVGALIYDPAADSLIPRTTVVIRGREIVAVSDTATIPDSAIVLNVSGLTLLPGLIDSHVHFSGIRSRIPDGARELGWLPYLWRFIRRFPERRRAFIEAGVTTVKSLGDPYPWIAKYAERVQRHELAGPRIFAAGPMLTTLGGHPTVQLRQAGQGDTSFIAQVARQLAGPAEAQVAVNEIARRVDFVTAVLETRGDPLLPSMALPILRMITYTAHGFELSVLAHISTVEQLQVAIAAGVDGIEHVPFDVLLDSLTLDELARRRVFVDPTLQAIDQYVGEMLADTAATRRARTNVQRLHTAGVPLVAGSDAPSPGTTFGFTLHEELRNLVEAGLTPGEAIAAATWVAAEYLDATDRLGSITPGKWADIIAVAGDPLLDIGAVADIYLVIADGQLLVNRIDRVRRPSVIALSATMLDHSPGPALMERPR